MSNNLPFDNHIKQQLGNYAPDVPPHIWSQIVAQREEQKPRGILAWFANGRNWLFVAALLLVAGGAAYWASTSTAPAQTDNALQNNSASELIANNTTSNNQPTNGNKLGTTQPNVNNNLNNNGITNSNDKVDNIDNTTAPSNQPTPSNLHFSQSPNNHFITRPNKPVRLAMKQLTAKQAIDNIDGTITENEENPFSIANGNLMSQRKGNALTTLGYSLPRLSGGMNPLFTGKQGASELRNKLLSNIILPDCPSVEDNAAGNKKYIDVYFGPDFGMRNFGSFSSDSTTRNYLQKRKESTRFASAFSAGIRYTKVFNNGMSLRSGLNYSQINEKFQYLNPRDIRYILVITPRDIISGGNVVTVYDTVRYTQTGTREKTTYNRYRSIDIPLQLGYEFGNGRLHTNISAGAIVNLYSWHKGDVLDSAYQPVSITTGKGSSAYGFKTNIGVGFLGSVSLYYKLTSRMHLLAEPYFRYNLQPMTRDNQNITQKYSTLGLRLGVRWDLK